MDLIDLETPDGRVEAYLTGSGPGVLFFIDAIGLRPQIAQMADRIAAWGYAVLAPNTLYRSGTAAQTSPAGDLREPGAREEFFRHAGPRLAELTPERLARDLPAYLLALHRTRGDVVEDSVPVLVQAVEELAAVRRSLQEAGRRLAHPGLISGRR